jgi:hypothetical protein
METKLKEKIYFSAGDLVMIKHEIANRPTMVVKSVDKIPMAKTGGLLGVTCFWFSSDMVMQQARFSTKDLTKEF